MNQNNFKQTIMENIFQNGLDGWKDITTIKDEWIYEQDKTQIEFRLLQGYPRAPYWIAHINLPNGLTTYIAEISKKTHDPRIDLKNALSASKNALAAKNMLIGYAMELGLLENTWIAWKPKESILYQLEESPLKARSIIFEKMNHFIQRKASNGALINQKSQMIVSASQGIMFKIPSSAHEKIEILKKNRCMMPEKYRQ